MSLSRNGSEEERALWERFRSGVSGGGHSPCPSPEDLASYIDGLASGKKAGEIEDHLAACPDCVEALGELRSMLKAPILDAPPEVRERAKALVGARRPSPARRRKALYPAWARSLGWGAAAAGVAAACFTGASLGRTTFRHRREIASATPLKIVMDVNGLHGFGIGGSVIPGLPNGG